MAIQQRAHKLIPISCLDATLGAPPVWQMIPNDFCNIKSEFKKLDNSKEACNKMKISLKQENEYGAQDC